MARLLGVSNYEYAILVDQLLDHMCQALPVLNPGSAAAGQPVSLILAKPHLAAGCMQGAPLADLIFQPNGPGTLPRATVPAEVLAQAQLGNAYSAFVTVKFAWITPGSFFDGPSATRPSNVHIATPGSGVMAVSIFGHKQQGLPLASAVTLTLMDAAEWLSMRQQYGTSVSCGWWDRSSSSSPGWLSSGCSTSFVGPNNAPVCSCTHLTEFAVRPANMVSASVMPESSGADTDAPKAATAMLAVALCLIVITCAIFLITRVSAFS